MKRFNTRKELIEAKAKESHNLNLVSGGVFNESLEMDSLLSNEIKLTSKRVVFVSEDYIKFENINEDKACYIIKNFGYAVA